MMSKINYFAMTLACLVTILSSAVDAGVVGDGVNASNTFQNPNFTNGAETIFAVGSATVADAVVEYNKFAGIYDLEFSSDTMMMTLADNSGLSFLSYDAGTFDRYYFGFDGHTVDSVAITGGDPALTNGLTVGLLSPGFELDVLDLFATGITVPREYPNGGFFLQFGEGTDLSTLGSSVSVGFTATAVPEPASGLILAGLAMFAILSRRRLVK